jgi:hypothetical protein
VLVVSVCIFAASFSCLSIPAIFFICLASIAYISNYIFYSILRRLSWSSVTPCVPLLVRDVAGVDSFIFYSSSYSCLLASSDLFSLSSISVSLCAICVIGLVSVFPCCILFNISLTFPLNIFWLSFVASMFVYI